MVFCKVVAKPLQKVLQDSTHAYCSPLLLVLINFRILSATSWSKGLKTAFWAMFCYTVWREVFLKTALCAVNTNHPFLKILQYNHTIAIRRMYVAGGTNPSKPPKEIGLFMQTFGGSDIMENFCLSNVLSHVLLLFPSGFCVKVHQVYVSLRFPNLLQLSLMRLLLPLE